MGKQFFYEFNGTILIKADNMDEAEKLLTGRDLNEYLINEEIYEVDRFYIATDIEQRIIKRKTDFHPIYDLEDYEEYKMRKHRYSQIFNDFIQGNFDRQELVRKMDEAESVDISKSKELDEIVMINLEPIEQKTFRFFYVGEKP